jgi:prophage antirepressor-like protein
MSKVTPFLFDGDITVRVIEENDRPAWVTVDVCRALGLKHAADAVRGLDDDEKGMATIHTLGGPRQMIVVYESGLYAMILRSRKEGATRFRKWIASEVLPSIRRTGSYAPAGAIVLQRPCTEWSFEEARRSTRHTKSSTRRPPLGCGNTKASPCPRRTYCRAGGRERCSASLTASI